MKKIVLAISLLSSLVFAKDCAYGEEKGAVLMVEGHKVRDTANGKIVKSPVNAITSVCVEKTTQNMFFEHEGRWYQLNLNYNQYMQIIDDMLSGKR